MALSILSFGKAERLKWWWDAFKCALTLQYLISHIPYTSHCCICGSGEWKSTNQKHGFEYQNSLKFAYASDSFDRIKRLKIDRNLSNSFLYLVKNFIFARKIEANIIKFMEGRGRANKENTKWLKRNYQLIWNETNTKKVNSTD